MKKDKIKHFIAGMAIFLIVWAIVNIHVALIATIVIAGGKEIYDHLSGKGTPEWADFWASVLLPIFLYLLSALYYSFL